MLFQTLDDKKDCYTTYIEHKFVDEIPNNVSRTWSYSNFLYQYDIEYAQIYCGGRTLGEVCPSHLQDRWDSVSNKLKAFIRSFHTASVDLNDNCFFDLTPKRFLAEYCTIKNDICEWIFDNYKKPTNYENLVNTQKVISDIKYRKLNLNLTPLKKYFHEKRARNLFKTYSSQDAYCRYDVFGSKTGRLSTMSGSFPIHNLKKEYRSIIEPNNDLLVELDYNAAASRVRAS